MRPRANLERSATEFFTVVLGRFQMGCFSLVTIETIIKETFTQSLTIFFAAFFVLVFICLFVLYHQNQLHHPLILGTVIRRVEGYIPDDQQR